MFIEPDPQPLALHRRAMLIRTCPCKPLALRRRAMFIEPVPATARPPQEGKQPQSGRTLVEFGRGDVFTCRSNGCAQ
jgi:hypothetical protein